MTEDEKVVVFPQHHRNMTVSQALGAVALLGLTEVFIIGYDQDENLVLKSSNMLNKDALWMIEAAKLELMAVVRDYGCYEGNEDEGA